MRILFTAQAAYSHLTKIKPLIKAVQRAGHEVLLATAAEGAAWSAGEDIPAATSGISYSEVQQRYAALVAAMPEQQRPKSPADRFLQFITMVQVDVVARTSAETLVPLARRWAPDVMVSMISDFAGEIAADLTGVPFLRHSFSPPKMTGATAAFGAAMQSLREEWGLTGDDRVIRSRERGQAPIRDADPYLDIWPVRARPAGVDEIHGMLYPNRWPICPDVYPPAAPDAPEVLRGLPHDRTVYVTAGTTWNKTPGVLEAMIDAVRGEPVDVVATVGHDVDIARFAYDQPNVRVVPFVAQELLLPYCHAVVCAAGAGTVLGALAHGVPVVALPVETDQHEIAGGAQHSGGGLACAQWPEGGSQLRDRYHEVMSAPSFVEAAGAVRREVLAMPTPDEVLVRVEKWVAEGGRPGI